MKIDRIYYNWHQGDMCEEYYCYRIGMKAPNGKTPVKIVEHTPTDIGLKWYYNVYFEDGAMSRLFNPRMKLYSRKKMINKCQSLQ